jgi:hypothetical protein
MTGYGPARPRLAGAELECSELGKRDIDVDVQLQRDTMCSMGGSRQFSLGKSSVEELSSSGNFAQTADSRRLRIPRNSAFPVRGNLFRQAAQKTRNNPPVSLDHQAR